MVGSGKLNKDITLARISSIQGLYELEICGADDSKTIFDIINHRYDDILDPKDTLPDKGMLGILIEGVSSNKSELDQIVSLCLDGDKSIQNIDTLLLTILRAGVYELTSLNTPKPVVIDEYVKVTKSFYLGKEGGFVNGVLDKIVSNLPSIKEKFSVSG